MKYLITILILIYSHSSISEEKDEVIDSYTLKKYVGEMTCEITDLTVLGQKDGKLKKYRGYPDIDIGDTLNFTYEYKIGKKKIGSNILFLHLTNRIAIHHFLGKYSVITTTNPGKKLIKDIDVEPTIVQISSYIDFPNHTIYTLQRDLLSYKENFWNGTDQSQFILKRYYKSDWMGTLNFSQFRRDFNETVITTIFMDCRHTTEDVWGEIFSHYYDNFDPTNEIKIK